MNPLVTDFESMKDAELESKMQDLTKKYFMTNNHDLQMQIANLIDVYKVELQSRRARAWQSEYQNRNKDLDNLIKVN
jgi:Holliday junction resolvase RusA-like endonuclease